MTNFKCSQSSGIAAKHQDSRCLETRASRAAFRVPESTPVEDSFSPDGRDEPGDLPRGLEPGDGNGQLRARLEHVNREFPDASMRLVVERLPRPFDAAAMLDNPDADDLFVCFHGPPIMGVGTR